MELKPIFHQSSVITYNLLDDLDGDELIYSNYDDEHLMDIWDKE